MIELGDVYRQQIDQIASEMSLDELVAAEYTARALDGNLTVEDWAGLDVEGHELEETA